MPRGLGVMGIVSMGAMGAAVATVVGRAGTRVVTSVEDRSEQTRRAASGAGAQPMGSLSALVEVSDAVVSLVPPEAAVTFAQKVAVAMRESGRRCYFIDGNSIAPTTLERVASEVSAAGGRVVDLCIIGPPPAPAAEGEFSKAVFYVAGPDAEILLPYRDVGLDVRVLDGPLGSAKALKMCYAAVTKGVIALVLEAYLGAHALGVADAFTRQMEDTQSAVLDQVRRQAKGFGPKAYRWVGEMQEMAATFGPLGLPTGMFDAAANLYGELALTPAGQPAEKGAMTLARIVDEMRSRMEHGAAGPA